MSGRPLWVVGLEAAYCRYGKMRIPLDTSFILMFTGLDSHKFSLPNSALQAGFFF